MTPENSCCAESFAEYDLAGFGQQYKAHWRPAIRRIGELQFGGSEYQTRNAICSRSSRDMTGVPILLHFTVITSQDALPAGCSRIALDGEPAVVENASMTTYGEIAYASVRCNTWTVSICIGMCQQSV
jgi:hypothetical protein